MFNIMPNSQEWTIQQIHPEITPCNTDKLPKNKTKLLSKMNTAASQRADYVYLDAAFSKEKMFHVTSSVSSDCAAASATGLKTRVHGHVTFYHHFNDILVQKLRDLQIIPFEADNFSISLSVTWMSD